MFRFIAEPHTLYLHCTVLLCDQDEVSSCTPVSSPNVHIYAFGSVFVQNLYFYCICAWCCCYNFSLVSLHRIVIQLLRGKQWDQTPTRASCLMDPSLLKFQTDLSPVTSYFFIVLQFEKIYLLCPRVEGVISASDVLVIVVLNYPVVFGVNTTFIFFLISLFISPDVLLTVVLIVAGIWSVGFFLVIITTVARAGSRRPAHVESSN